MDNLKHYNDIGISNELDWERIEHLFRIGFFGALLSFIGDMMLGWGVEDESLAGILRLLSAYTGHSDGKIFAVALLGLFGMTLEGLSFFSIYRLIASKSMKLAHTYRSGILGYTIFGGCGYHIPVCAAVFLMKHGFASDLILKYMLYFVLPGVALFMIFFIVLLIAQIKAFATGMTPYPKWCAIFSILFGFLIAVIASLSRNHAWANAVYCAWLGIGNLWMFGGLMVLAKKLPHD